MVEGATLYSECPYVDLVDGVGRGVVHRDGVGLSDDVYEGGAEFVVLGVVA